MAVIAACHIGAFLPACIKVEEVEWQGFSASPGSKVSGRASTRVHVSNGISFQSSPVKCQRISSSGFLPGASQKWFHSHVSCSSASRAFSLPTSKSKLRTDFFPARWTNFWSDGLQGGSGYLPGGCICATPSLASRNYFPKLLGLCQLRCCSRHAGAKRVIGVAAALAQESLQPPLEDEGFDDEQKVESRCLLQAFSWTSHGLLNGKTWYEHILEKADDLSELGFSDVLLPPCTQSLDQQGFMPSNFYDLNSAYGSSAQLKAVLAKLHERGLRACAEIVLNRLAGNQPEGHVAWKRVGGTVDEEIDWGNWDKRSGSDSDTANLSSDEEYGSLPAIDHSDPMVQGDAKGWLAWLKNDVGFDAWCFDLAKMFDPSAVYLYCQASKPEYAVGDVWNPMRYNGMTLEYDQDQHRQALVDWVKATRGSAMALDYTTKGILQQAVERCEYWRLIDPMGRPPGLIGWWPSKAITFIDNHTTGSAPRHWPFPNWGVMLGYSYILTHPGTPCVFWDHVYDWQHRARIEELLQARKRNGIHSRSELRIMACHPDLYVARIGQNVDKDDFRGLIVKMGPTFNMRGTTPGVEWTVCASGQDYCVWERLPLDS